MKARTPILALLPGAAHIDLGRLKRGLFCFFFFALFVNGALIAPFLTDGRGARTGCLLAAAGIWIASFYDALRAAAKRERAARKPPSEIMEPAGQKR